MAEVTLKIKADPSNAVKGLKDVQNQAQKTYTVFDEMSAKRQVQIQKEIQMQEQLSQRIASSKNNENIKTWNKLIEGSKSRLEDLKKAQQNVTKTGTESTEQLVSSGKRLMGVYAGIATAIASVAASFRVLKNAVMETETGFNNFNVVMAASKQLLYDIIQRTPMKEWGKNMKEVAGIQNQLNELRKIERESLKEVAQYQVLYNKYLVEAKDQTKSITERLTYYNYALIAHNRSVDLENKNTATRLALVREWLKTAPDNKAFLEEESALELKLLGIEEKRFASQKEINSMRTGLIKQQNEEEKALQEKHAKEMYDFYHDYYEGLRFLAEEALKAREKSDEEYWKFNLDIGKKLWQQNKDLAKVQWAEWAKIMGFDPDTGEPLPGKDVSIWSMLGLDEDEDSGKIEALKEIAASIKDVLQDVFDKQVEIAERERELLDTRISETQQALETEVELYKAGYASNVALKQKELDNLKKQRDIALKEEEEALKKQRTFETISQTMSLMSSVANILKEFTKLGPIGLVLSTVAIGGLFAIFAAAKNKAAEATKFAKGGWTGKGSYRDETGENVAGIVHEDEFVVRKGPARRFREVLEAINKEDRGLIINRFNKIQPEIMPVNNILVENNGPNNRLDRVNNKLTLISKQLEPRKDRTEKVTDNGKELIYQKGNTLRIVRR